MRVKLVDWTSKGVDESATIPYQTETELRGALAHRVFDLGHRSIGRHGNVVFMVDGLSQDALRQLSRHPHINLTVKSSRYCDMSYATPFIPEWVRYMPNNRFMLQDFEDDYCTILDIYEKWQRIEKLNNQKDTAKLFLPLCSTTDVMISGNFQAMYEFLQLRLCERTQEEMRLLAKAMVQAIVCCEDMTVANIVGNVGCKGSEYGICPESDKDCCGKYPTRSQCSVVPKLNLLLDKDVENGD